MNKRMHSESRFWFNAIISASCAISLLVLHDPADMWMQPWLLLAALVFMVNAVLAR